MDRGGSIMATKLSAQYLEGFVKPQECEAMAPQVKLAHEALHAGTGLGNDFLGWIKLPTDYDKVEFFGTPAAVAVNSK